MTAAHHVRLMLLLSSGLLGASAIAQTPDRNADAAKDGLETVQVTVQRQAFRGDIPIEELPQSVQLISSELLADVGVTQLDDVLDLASGVARQNTFGGLWDAFAIRGFAGDENTPTGYLVNGFSAGRGFSGRRDTSNVERVEVVKGPGSALYGRAEPGGTINIVTRKPEFESEGSVELTVGRFNTYRLAADYTAPFSDSVAFRINGAYEDAESFRDFIERKKYVVTPSVLFRIGDRTTLSYELEVLEQKVPFDRGIVAPFGQLGAIPITRFLGEPGDGDTTIDATGHQLVLQSQFAGSWMLNIGAGYRESSFEGFSSDPELLVGARQPFYVDGQTLARQRRFRDYDATDLTTRAEISGRIEAGSMTHHLLAGVDYYDYELTTLQNRFRPAAGNFYSVNVFAPVYGQTRTPGPFQNLVENQDATGFYLQDQIDLGEQWKVLVGVRFDDFSQTILNRIANSTQTADNKETSPRFGLVYEQSDALSFYLSWSKGFRPNTGVNFAGTAFKPEFSKSYEIGTKWQTGDGRIGGTVAIYKAEKSNVLTADPINAGFSIAAGEAESQGLEVDIAGQLSDSVRFTFAYAYTDAEVTKSALDPNFGLALPAGSRLINIPQSAANVLFMKDFEVGTGKFSAGVGATYVGRRLGETGVPAFSLPSYTLINATASWSPNDRVKLTLDIDNAFDETYYPSSYARLWVAPGEPRMYQLRALFSF